MDLIYKVENNNFINVKDVLKNHFQISDKLMAKLKKEKKIFLNDTPVYVTEKVNINDLVRINLDFEEESENIVSIKMDLKILYEDKYLLIVNKPPFMPVHPSSNNYENTLSNGVKYYFETNNLNIKIRPVNRLDKDTSGIVVFAKNQYIQEALIKQMKTNDFKKEYIAVLEGNLEEDYIKVNAPIGRKENSIIERQVINDGANSITEFYVLKRFENYTLVKCLLLTGRTHQIRVHSKHINHPIIGDSLYGNKSDLINRQALHSNKIEFIHPVLNKQITIISEIPVDIEKIMTGN